MRGEPSMKQPYVLHIKDLILLCHIADDLEAFNQDLEVLIEKLSKKEVLRELRELSKKNPKCIHTVVSEFFDKHRDTINSINEHTRIDRFLRTYYDTEGKMGSRSNLPYFYHYIKSHRENQEQLLSTASKIKDLDFTTIEMQEGWDFSGTYQMDTEFSKNLFIVYSKVVEFLPSYSDEQINYEISSSPYIIISIPDESGTYKTKRILVNTLLFSPSILPNGTSKEDTFDDLIKRKSNTNLESENALRIAIDWNKSIYGLKTNLSTIEGLIENLNQETTTPQLIQAIQQIKSGITVLQQNGEIYEQQVLELFPSTSDKLKEEKHVYMKTYHQNSRSLDT